jgi:anti-sigma B factor antagonist
VGHQNRIETAEVGTVAVLTLSGEHDLSTAPELGEALARPGACVVVDLSATSFIDSSVLAALLAASRSADALSVVAPDGGFCRRVIRLTGIDAAFATCETVEQALREVLDCVEPRDADEATALLSLADDLLDAAWQADDGVDQALALARRLSLAVGREPAIEDAKILVANEQKCTPSEAFQRLIIQSQTRNEKLADLARRLTVAIEATKSP